MERIEAALMAADLFVSIGTSGAVYPAAGFVQTARYCGAQTLEINLEPSQGSAFFDEQRYGRASDWCRRGSPRCWTEGVLRRRLERCTEGPRPRSGLAGARGADYSLHSSPMSL